MGSGSSERVVYTIGHSTRPAEEFVELLQTNDVDMLVDVRRYPGSRRHPAYNSEALQQALAEAGIGYRHAPDLGGRRGKGDRPEAGTPSPNRGWRNASFRAYADYMGTDDFAAALDQLKADVQDATVAIMCAEAVPWRCHRNLISDALVAGDFPVRHIISSAEPSAHSLKPMARVDEQGRLTYPGDEDDQRELF